MGRGNYYNHSGFADLLFTGLIGLRPRARTVALSTATAAARRASGATSPSMRCPIIITLLTVVWDATGTRYHHGKGMTLLVDGRKVASRKDLGVLEYEMK